jgi:hypothetical protein
MPLFFCKWADRASLLVDDEDSAAARAVARDVAEGEPPTDVVPLRPRFFVAEVLLGDEGLMLVEPLDHVEQALALLDGVDDEDEQEDEDELAEDGDECAAEAEGDGGDVFVCTLPANHGPPRHESRGEDGTLMASWEVK